jgi:hypothetical protein
MMYVDPEHVALSFQFFNKTRENIMANPQATALVIDPVSADSFRLALVYLRTETEGPLFAAMKAKLAGIASHTGMSDVFRLQGVDIYRVRQVEPVQWVGLPRPRRGTSRPRALRMASALASQCQDLGALFDQMLALLAREFGMGHSMLLMADGPRQRLYTVASRGYSTSGVGSEIAFGDGVIGVAALHQVPIRINHMTIEYRYGSVSLGGGSTDLPLETAIPFPGLADPHSQLAVPICGGGRLLGVLCVESAEDLAFDHDDEDALVVLAGLIGGAVLIQQADDETAGAGTPAPPGAPREGPVLEVRHYRANHSVFVGADYLIKGVAGAILWKLLALREATGRCEITNRELRAMTDLGLPDVGDNLEARLVLLQRRLAERCPAIGLQKVGRGQLRLVIERELRLVEVDA